MRTQRDEWPLSERHAKSLARTLSHHERQKRIKAEGGLLRLTYREIADLFSFASQKGMQR